MDSQMRGFTDVCVHQEALGRSCQGVAEEQTCHRLGLAGGWARVAFGSAWPTCRHWFLPAGEHQPRSQPRPGTTGDTAGPNAG